MDNNPPSNSPPTPPPQPQITPNQPIIQPTNQHNRHTLFLIVLFLAIFLGGILFSVWYLQSQLTKSEKTKAQIAQQNTYTLPKTIIIASDVTFPPMEFYNKQGELVGFDIDLGNNLANELGTKTQFKNVPWDNIFKELDEKKVDIIISSVTITNERKQKWLFSQPYLNAGEVILTQKTSSISAVTDLKGKKIGVQKNTTDEKQAVKYTSNNLVIRYDDYQKATQALVKGEVDAILSDLTGAKGMITDNPTLKIASDPLTNEYYGVVLRKQDEGLQKKINEAISNLSNKGILDDLKQKWLE